MREEVADKQELGQATVGIADRIGEAGLGSLGEYLEPVLSEGIDILRDLSHAGWCCHGCLLQ